MPLIIRIGETNQTFRRLVDPFSAIIRHTHSCTSEDFPTCRGPTSKIARRSGRLIQRASSATSVSRPIARGRSSG